MLNIHKCGFTSDFCIGVYVDDLATMTGNYFTHIKEIVDPCTTYFMEKDFLKKQKKQPY